MPLKPIGKQILVQKIPPDRKFGSGLIIMPDTTIRKSNQGIVKAIGEEVEHVQLGWYIGFEEMRGLDVNDKHGEYHLVSEDDVDYRIETEPEIIPGLFHELASPTNAVDVERTSYFPATLDSIFSCVIEHFANKPRIINRVREIR